MSQPQIRVLSDATINQIAAGEVIENPASVIKELVENAIDAGATRIDIATTAGGRALIRVADDGHGMSKDNLLLSVERHATSKLTNTSDLEVIQTLGFRGEALPSIAAVSKMSLHSAPESGKGILLRLEGGRMDAPQPLPRRRGTTIEVRSLFFNVPVRKKFQKSVGWDVGEIHKTLMRFALCYPEIGFSWTCDEKVEIDCAPGGGWDQRIAKILGEEFMEASLPVEHRADPLVLTGRIARPTLHRSNRTGQYLFINQRAVLSPWISQKVLEAYGTRLSLHRFPLFVLSLTLPGSWVDVNVHPQKREVRLREEERLAPFLMTAIEKGLDKPSTPTSTPHISIPQLQEPVRALRETETIYRLPKEEPVLFEEPSIRVIGKVKHYFLVEEKEGVRVVDGLRAMERVVYEQLRKEKGKQEVQSLLLPIQLTFTGKEKALLLEAIPSLDAMGVSVRHFGGDTFLVDAIPAILELDEIPELIQAYLEEGQVPRKIGKCLKRGTLSQGAAPALLKKLFACADSHLTPTGEKIHSLLDEHQLKRLIAI